MKNTIDVPAGAFCDHASMTECCDGCGHFSCPCGLEWDDGAFSSFFEEDLEQIARDWN